jgi:hypothetical protein
MNVIRVALASDQKYFPGLFTTTGVNADVCSQAGR